MVNPCCFKLAIASKVLPAYSLKVVDTLMVDPGEEIILVENQSSRIDVSDNRRYYFNFNWKLNHIDMIDLDKMVLEQQVKLERDGPNGTGSQVSRIDYYGEGNFMINDFNSNIRLFDQERQQIDQFRLDQETLKGDTLGAYERINTSGGIDAKGRTYFSYYSDFSKGPEGIAKVDIPSRTLTKIPVKGIEAINAYQVTYEVNGGISKRSASFHFQYLPGKILISNSAINELFFYDTRKDSLYHYQYESTITPNRQQPLRKTNAGSREEFNEIGKDIGRKLNFGQPVYDPAQGLYYRLTVFREDVNQSNWNTVLTVFDDHLEMIAENELEDFPMAWRPSFVKDNMIYFAVNIEDELAFIRAKMVAE